jgi:hypothetical protein
MLAAFARKTILYRERRNWPISALPLQIPQ